MHTFTDENKHFQQACTDIVKHLQEHFKGDLRLHLAAVAVHAAAIEVDKLSVAEPAY